MLYSGFAFVCRKKNWFKKGSVRMTKLASQVAGVMKLMVGRFVDAKIRVRLPQDSWVIQNDSDIYFSSSSRRFNIPGSPRKTLGVSGSKHHKRRPNLGQRQRNAFVKGMRLSTKAAARAQQVPCKATLAKPREASRSSKFHYFSCGPLLAELQCIDDIKTKKGSKTQWGLGSVEPWSHHSKNELFWATVIKSNALEVQTKK